MAKTTSGVHRQPRQKALQQGKHEPRIPGKKPETKDGVRYEPIPKPIEDFLERHPDGALSHHPATPPTRLGDLMPANIKNLATQRPTDVIVPKGLPVNSGDPKGLLP